jgi:hypothetical protein
VRTGVLVQADRIVRRDKKEGVVSIPAAGKIGYDFTNLAATAGAFAETLRRRRE